MKKPPTIRVLVRQNSEFASTVSNPQRSSNRKKSSVRKNINAPVIAEQIAKATSSRADSALFMLSFRRVPYAARDLRPWHRRFINEAAGTKTTCREFPPLATNTRKMLGCRTV